MIKGRPSGSTAIPLQNMSQLTGCVVTVPVCGSKTPACRFVFVGTLPEPETTSTLPLLSTAACAGLIGMRFGSVCHCPARLLARGQELANCRSRLPPQGRAENIESFPKKPDRVGLGEKGACGNLLVSLNV